jgi:hypothetical protein
MSVNSARVGSRRKFRSWLGGYIMRLMPLMSAVLVAFASSPSFAQEWIEFANQQDRFTCNFPSQPKVAETTFRTERGADVPMRVYSATQGQSRYSVTVIDYSQVRRILAEKAKTCPPGAEPCSGAPGNEGHWIDDVRGAVIHASWQLMKRDARLTSFEWNLVDQVEGQQLQLTNTADKSRTFAGIYMHENKLYIIEGTVPAGYPEPGFFQQSLGWLDENGVGLRYQSVDNNNYPAPPRVKRGREEQGQGRIDAPVIPR